MSLLQIGSSVRRVHPRFPVEVMLSALTRRSVAHPYEMLWSAALSGAHRPGLAELFDVAPSPHGAGLGRTPAADILAIHA